MGLPYKEIYIYLCQQVNIFIEQTQPFTRTLSHIQFLSVTQMLWVFCSQAMKFEIFTIFQHSNGNFLCPIQILFSRHVWEKSSSHLDKDWWKFLFDIEREWNGCRNKCALQKSTRSAILQKKKPRIFICRCIFSTGMQHNLIVYLFVSVIR